jgi:hypothetical protein
MDSIGFYLFCLSIGYVIVWFLVNERRGNENGEWGFLTIRQTSKLDKAVSGNKSTPEQSSRTGRGNRWR